MLVVGVADLTVTLAAVIFAVVCGATPSRAAAGMPPAGSIAAEVDEQLQDLHPVLEPIRAKRGLPALAAAVVRGNRTIALGAAGVRKFGADAPVTVNDQFHLGSCTKAMTATLVAWLVEHNRLSWHMMLAAAFPELAEEMHPAYRFVTLRQLLAHRGGTPPADRSWPEGKTFWDMHRLPGSAREQRRAYVRLILKQAPAVKPGTEYLYSNAGYAVLGAAAERVTNIPWEDLMRQVLFQPLGMATAGFGAMGTPDRIGQPWQHRFDGEPVPIAPGPLSDNPPVIGPAGTVHCSPGDWAKFVIAHLKGERGESSLLQPETFRALHTPEFGGDYAAGWTVTTRDWAGGRVLTHAGSNNQNYAVAWVAPVRDFAVLVATNQGGGEAPEACDEVASSLIRQFLLKPQTEAPGQP